MHDLDNGVGPRGGRSTHSQYGVRLSLYLPGRLYAAVKEVAVDQGRSLNAVMAEILTARARDESRILSLHNLSRTGRRVTLYLDPDLVEALRIRSVRECVSLSSLISSLLSKGL